MDKIILFDGECNFCNGSVQFILKRDPHAVFKFASLQSEAGERLKIKYGIPEDENSFILIDENRYFSKSTASLRVARKLSGAWRFCYGFIIIPRPIRDLFYHIFSKNRYKWFGKSEQCFLPTPDVRKRFL